MPNTTPYCFFYPQKKLKYSAQICPRKAPIGSEQSQDWYPNLQLPLGPPSPAQAIRIQQGLKGTSHMTDLRWCFQELHLIASQ